MKCTVLTDSSRIESISKKAELGSSCNVRYYYFRAQVVVTQKSAACWESRRLLVVNHLQTMRLTYRLRLLIYQFLEHCQSGSLELCGAFNI